ncbi:helix-turn-helix domain-containing protein [Sphaerisporangium sp. NPDC088356]|uniref:helix-turn-helix domain-containing protein n=1 Tax=Sphaerisporangium sp. NPDC088356 TaxID=3154871 RepID=UPI00342FBE8B
MTHATGTLRELIVEGTLEGLASARARGPVGGRPRSLDVDGIETARALYEMKGQDGKRKYTVQQIADRLGVGRATIYRNLDSEPNKKHRQRRTRSSRESGLAQRRASERPPAALCGDSEFLTYAVTKLPRARLGVPWLQRLQEMTDVGEGAGGGDVGQDVPAAQALTRCSISAHPESRLRPAVVSALSFPLAGRGRRTRCPPARGIERAKRTYGGWPMHPQPRHS